MVNHGDETHVTSIRVFKANQVPSSAQVEGLFFFHATTKIATIVSHDGLIEEIKPAEQIKENTVPFDPRRLCCKEHIQELSEFAVIRSRLFVPVNYEPLSREISECLSTFQFYVNTDPSVMMTSRIRILIQVHRTRVTEYPCNFYRWFSKQSNAFIEQESCSGDEDEDEEEEELLGSEELMDFRADLNAEARLSSARVEIGDELLEGFSEVFGVKVMESDEENCGCSICLEGFLMGMEVVKAPNCFHLFHRSCLLKWLARSSTCPMCRGSCFVVV